MRSKEATPYLKIASGLLYMVLSLPALERVATAQEPFRPVPRASCGSGDRQETLQGQTTLAERFRVGPAIAYNCNLELIGQFEGEGAADGLALFDKCAYFSIAENPPAQHPGVAVLDISDLRHPELTGYLNSPAMLTANESLTSSASRGLLLASAIPNIAAAPFDLYDLSNDCRHPVLRSSKALPRVYSHAGKFAESGQTYYGAIWGIAMPTSGSPDATFPTLSGVFAIDTTDVTNPRTLATWIPAKGEWKTHAVSLNREGSRAYVSLMRLEDDRDKSPSPNGLAILDISDIQAHKPNAQFHLVSTLFWADTHLAQLTLPVQISGHSYLIWTDLAGALGLKTPPPPDVCGSDTPNYGFARIIDIGDEQHPKTTSKLMLEVDDPANCAKVVHDPTLPFGYGSFGCDVDNEQDAKLLACGRFEAGLRVFDIRDPVHPVEVAYYKPAARRTQRRPGSMFFGMPTKDHTADQVIIPKFLDHGQVIGFISFDNGFQVVRFTDRFRASHRNLFQSP